MKNRISKYEEYDLLGVIKKVFNDNRFFNVKGELNLCMFIKKQLMFVWDREEYLALKYGYHFAPKSSSFYIILRFIQLYFIPQRSLFDIFFNLFYLKGVSLLPAIDPKQLVETTSFFKPKVYKYRKYVCKVQHEVYDNCQSNEQKLKIKENDCTFVFQGKVFATTDIPLSLKFDSNVKISSNQHFNGGLFNALGKLNIIEMIPFMRKHLTFIVDCDFLGVLITDSLFLKVNNFLNQHNFIFCDQMLCLPTEGQTLVITENDPVAQIGQTMYFFRKKITKVSTNARQRFNNVLVYDQNIKGHLLNKLSVIIQLFGGNVDSNRKLESYMYLSFGCNDWKLPTLWFDVKLQ